MTHHPLRAVFACMTLALAFTVPAFAQDKPATAPIDPAAVQAAIKKGVEYVYSQQRPDGSWEESPRRIVADPKKKDLKGHEPHSVTGGQWGGQTALTTYALLAAGESPQDPRLAKAIDWLKKADIKGVYALGMRAQVWLYLPKNNETYAAARRDWSLLGSGVRADRPGLGTYDYLIDSPPRDKLDLSVSQYGVLGAWACAQLGVEVPTKYWQLTEEAWRHWQKEANGNGGWSYRGKPDDDHPVNLPIAAAGVATLFITQDYTQFAEGLKCNGNISNKSIEEGLKYIQSNIGELLKGDGKKNKNPYYTLYGIERIGVASGLKYFGTIDWYQTGAKWLLEKQDKKNGAWSTSKTSGAGGGFCNNAFALIFLSRGSAPVSINKLQYELTGLKEKQESHWSQRPRDVANVVHWMGDQIERSLNWQVVNLNVAVRDLHDAPILYLAGNQPLAFSPEDEAKLKDFIEQGGLIVGNPDCNEKAFSTSFRELGKKLFNTEFRELPENHLIYTIHFKRDQMKKKPRWQGLSNGARELMVLIGDDAARSWQGNQYGGNDADFQTMLNVYKYAIDRESMREKGKTHIVTPDPKATPKQTIKLARAEYEGNWNPEPGGWTRFKAVMLNQNAVGLDVSTVKLGSAEVPADVKVLHITGTGPLNLAEPARAAIRKFVEGGGTLVIDAAGGNSEFASAAEGLLTAMFPAEAKQLEKPLSPDHGLFSAAGKKQDEFRYRGGVKGIEGRRSPNLRGIELNGRLAVLYSREDLSVGLVGMSMAGIAGYDPDVATDLMKNIVLYAQNPKK